MNSLPDDVGFAFVLSTEGQEHPVLSADTQAADDGIAIRGLHLIDRHRAGFDHALCDHSLRHPLVSMTQ